MHSSINLQEWEEHGVVQHHFITVDFIPPTLDSIKEGLQIITRARSKKHSVYIHCKAGRGRSAVMAACYLMSVSITLSTTFEFTVFQQRYNWTPNEAIDFLKQKRPQVKLNGRHRAAIDNFQQQLLHKTL